RRTRRAEGDAGELQPRRRLVRAFLDEVERALFHRLVLLVLENLEAVDDGADRTDDIVTDARTQERRKIERFKRLQLAHSAFPPLKQNRITPLWPKRTL